MVVLGVRTRRCCRRRRRRTVDSVVVGEAEHTWPLRARGRGARPPAAVLSGRGAALALGAPWRARRDLIRGRGLLESTIIATRGCPHRCSYCKTCARSTTPASASDRSREVAAEVRTFRAPFFTFWDDQLFMDPAYAMRLFGALEGAGKRWAAMVTLASTANDKLLRAAARAGCACLFLGLESFSTESLRWPPRASTCSTSSATASGASTATASPFRPGSCSASTATKPARSSSRCAGPPPRALTARPSACSPRFRARPLDGARDGRLLTRRLELLQRQDRRHLSARAHDPAGPLERLHVLPPPLLLARMHSPATRPFARAHGAIPRPQPGLRTCSRQPVAWLADPRPAA